MNNKLRKRIINKFHSVILNKTFAKFNFLRNYTKRQSLVLSIGIIAWFVIQGLLVNYPLWTRSLPPEVDDSYSYIYRSVQMEECFFQDCKALKDLGSQVYGQVNDPSESIEVKKGAYRILVDVFFTYHPLFSAVQVSINSIFDSWVLTHKITSVLGYLLIGVGVTYFLISIGGPIIAGISLVLISIQAFPDQGLNYIVPSNISLGFAFFLFGSILKKNGKVTWELIVGSAVMITMHTVGYIYSGLAIMLSVILRYKMKKLKYEWRTYLITILFIMGYYSLQYLIEVPDLKMPINPEIIEKGFIIILMDGFINAFYLFKEFARPYGIFYFNDFINNYSGLILFFVFVVYGIFNSNRNKGIHKNLLIFMLMYSVSIYILGLTYYVLSIHPMSITLFNRLIIILEIVLVSYVSHGLYALCIKSIQNKRFVICALIIIYLRAGLTKNSWSIAQMTVSKYKRHSYSFNFKQPKIIFENETNSKNVLYNDEYVLLPYLSHGAHNYGAVYENGNKINKLYEDVDYFVFRNPINSLSIVREEKIPSISFNSIIINFKDSVRIDDLNIFIENGNKNVELNIRPFDKKGKELKSQWFTVPSGYSGWYTIGFNYVELLNKIELVFTEDSLFWIKGVNFGQSRLNWPWNYNVDITFTPSNGDYYEEYFPYLPSFRITDKIQSISFDLDKIINKNLISSDNVILNDDGFTILVKLNKL